MLLGCLAHEIDWYLVLGLPVDPIAAQVRIMNIWVTSYLFNSHQHLKDFFFNQILNWNTLIGFVWVTERQFSMSKSIL